MKRILPVAEDSCGPVKTSPEGEVDGAAELLVEEDRADRAGDAVVGADAELAEVAGALVGVE